MKTIRELRQERGLSQFSLALEIGVTQSSIRDWESGETKPGYMRLRRLAEFFGISTEDISLNGYKTDVAK